jgi:hypothetical protein
MGTKQGQLLPYASLSFLIWKVKRVMVSVFLGADNEELDKDNKSMGVAVIISHYCKRLAAEGTRWARSSLWEFLLILLLLDLGIWLP